VFLQIQPIFSQQKAASHEGMEMGFWEGLVTASALSAVQKESRLCAALAVFDARLYVRICRIDESA